MPEPTPIPTEQLQFAMPPRHTGVEEERRHRKERLTAALRLFARYGFEEGVSGHITARDPEFTDCFWVNPFGVSFALMTVGDLILVNGEGKVVEGRHHVNQAAFTIHAQVHRARPDVVAVAHSHSTHGRALAALGEPLDPITQDVCAFYEDHALYDAYTGVVVDEEEGRRIAAVLGPHKAVILRNHGLLTVADSVDAAAWWFLAMERSCQVQLAAKAAGKPVLISHQDAVRTREQLGNDLVAWINYQPLYQQIARSEPEMFG
ncbi:class II aldolase/adducin family protein [Streptomyces noursei]|uniref:class II aldolase/adducin family protein n=1 Tax=Streptomyces noursei TaxID=1971 RepID=UPI001679C979|nr:class II aldolase/adducin family protein [Streptomyces noursei]MCZ1017547.1 class II aldolase/adducin family protein [Streptomyces noursei]GGX15070.1 class II aldolase/adducin family protein [Streptomyces noursei]